ncbi:MAG: glycosyltransferase family protein [Bacteroidota bacterium]
MPHIFYAVLDWGLGHATRSAPLIEALLEQGAQVTIGSNTRALTFLRQRFPQLNTIELPRYDVKYPTGSMAINLIWQMPRLLRTLYRERRMIKRLVEEYGFDGIISDNRLGCYHSSIPSVFISHQLHLKAPLHWQEWAVNLINHRIVRRHSACWIPDVGGEGNLAGSLAHPPVHERTTYLGATSLLTPQGEALDFDVLAMISGPEPQRSRFQKKLLEQLKDLPYRAVMVLGKPEADPTPQKLTDRLMVIPFAQGAELSRLIDQAEVVVCRSGYSSMMDLAQWGKKALLVPTPGQTEQVYLGKWYAKMGWCVRQKQREIDLSVGIPLAKQKSGLPVIVQDNNHLRETVRAFLAETQTKQFSAKVGGERMRLEGA